MWTPADRVLVGDFGAGQALTDDQFRLLEPLIPPARPGGRPRTTNIRNLLDGLFYLVRTGCQWRHLPPPPAFPPWRTGSIASIKGFPSLSVYNASKAAYDPSRGAGSSTSRGATSASTYWAPGLSRPPASPIR